jgi:4,5-DOPA dioxygenase extradiol
MFVVPSIFISHASPYLAVQTNEYTKFLNDLGKNITPKAIVIFSAHWESEVLSITYTDDVLDTVYDYYGFPEEMYKIKYPAKGSIKLSEMLESKFADNGIKTNRETKRGLDHGSWVALKHMYPDANIPVVQVSVNPYLSVKEQYNIGRALQGIGKEDILVIGSGTTVHNLRQIFPNETKPRPEATEFDDWLIDKVQNWDMEALERYVELAPHARFAVPRAEHFVPLFNAMGSGDELKTAKVINRSYEMGTFSNLCFQF